jgi:hypothetical protein
VRAWDLGAIGRFLHRHRQTITRKAIRIAPPRERRRELTKYRRFGSALPDNIYSELRHISPSAAKRACKKLLLPRSFNR